MSDQSEPQPLDLIRDQNAMIINYLKAINEQLNASRTTYRHVKIEDINMPFIAMVGFMIKITLASIPAALIIALLWLLVMLVFGGLLAGCTRVLF
ncbi:MAG TPA: hypothetical protein VJL34_08370 [Anaerolineales bacterium]|nr:hypothetical protein [Anaerolineales bacterium]